MSERPLAVAASGRGLVEPDSALIAADDEGFALGRGAFDTLRIYGGRPFRLAEHLDRLAGSVERLSSIVNGSIKRLPFRYSTIARSEAE